MEAEAIRVAAPASIANLGPGFDVLAVAVSAGYDVATVWLEPGRGRVKLIVEGPYADGVPRNPEANTAGVVAKRLVEVAGLKGEDIVIRLWKGVPVRKGLGSSGASAAAAAVAVSKLLRLRLNIAELVRLAGEAEALSASTPHYDNVAASILGGLVVVDPSDGYPVRLGSPRLKLLVVTPKHVTKPSTAAMRRIVPEMVPMGIAVAETAKAVELVKGLLEGDCSLVSRALREPSIVDAARSKLYKFYEPLRKALVERGAAGVALAGAGPSIVTILCTDNGASLVNELSSELGLGFEVRVVDVDPHGAIGRVERVKLRRGGD